MEGLYKGGGLNQFGNSIKARFEPDRSQGGCRLPAWLIAPASIFVLLLLSALAVGAEAMRVGVTLPLTGMAAEYGEAFRNGIDLCLSDRPELKEKVAYLFEDDAYDSRRTVAAVRKLTSADDTDILFVWGISTSAAAAHLSSQLRTPLIISTVNPDARGRPTVVNLGGPLSRIVRLFHRYIEDRGYRHVALAAAQIGALQAFAQDLESLLRSSGKTLHQENVTPDLMDFRSLILRLRSQQVDFFGALLTPDQIPVFAQQAQALGFRPPIFGPETFASENVLARVGEQLQDLVFFDWFVEDEFEDRYRRRFGTVSHAPEAAKGYLLAILLSEVARLARDHSPAALLTAIRALPAGNGPAGKYRFEETPDFGSHISLQGRLKRGIRGRIEDLPAYSTEP